MAEEEKKEKAAAEPRVDMFEAAERISKGKYTLKTPIMDGEKQYDALNYDFNALTAMELARALDTGANGRGDNFSLTGAQALALFAASAAKCTGGLDATDIRERMSAADGLGAIRVATIFFNSSSLAGSLRFSRE